LLYHDKCPDGFGSKYAFYRRFKDEIEYLAISHNEKKYYGVPETDLLNRKIYMADICCQRQDLEYLAKYSDITVLDHHLTSANNCGDLEYCHFDMSHSGSVLSWNFCFPNTEAPFLLRCIEDRDIWKWKIPNSKTYLSVIDSYPKTLESWAIMEIELESPELRKKFLVEGEAIERHSDILIDRLSRNSYLKKVQGYEVPVVNAPLFQSEVLAKLSEEFPFAIGYYFNGKNYICSLRSNKKNPNAVNVSEIASKIAKGGGGHFNASGCQIDSLDELR
jgi:oligoribonuclease NrnB/cAMP/cGMP phosphodiesterase (DHH superfamily)